MEQELVCGQFIHYKFKWHPEWILGVACHVIQKNGNTKYIWNDKTLSVDAARQPVRGFNGHWITGRHLTDMKPPEIIPIPVGSLQERIYIEAYKHFYERGEA